MGGGGVKMDPFLKGSVNLARRHCSYLHCCKKGVNDGKEFFCLGPHSLPCA